MYGTDRRRLATPLFKDYRCRVSACFVTAFLGGVLAKGLVVPGDAAATANSILAHEALYRSGFAVSLIANVIYIAQHQHAADSAA
jgi:hypothetical protein